MSEVADQNVHTVTLRFTGPMAEEMANHFFSSWVDGGISQVWAEALDEADIAEAIEYEADEETRVLSIVMTEADDEHEDAEDEKTAEDDDEQEEAA